jgi:hypothetical protein
MKALYRGTEIRMPRLEPVSIVQTSEAETYYTLAEIAELWRVSEDTVRRLFENEPGVLVLGDSRPRWKRRYRTIRVPASVLERVRRMLSLYSQ